MSTRFSRRAPPKLMRSEPLYVPVYVPVPGHKTKVTFQELDPEQDTSSGETEDSSDADSVDYVPPEKRARSDSEPEEDDEGEEESSEEEETQRVPKKVKKKKNRK